MLSFAGFKKCVVRVVTEGIAFDLEIQSWTVQRDSLARRMKELPEYFQ